MRARVASGTDGVSDLLSTSDTAACDTPAASAISFCVGREFGRALRPLFGGIRVDAVIFCSYTYYQNNINKLDSIVSGKKGVSTCQ
jgi:hypothetical protein